MKAKMNICSLKFEKAKHVNTISAYEEFIEDCSESLEADTAIMKARELRPISGTWLGNDIQFNVSLDGKTICKQNSKLSNTCSITLTIWWANPKKMRGKKFYLISTPFRLTG